MARIIIFYESVILQPYFNEQRKSISYDAPEEGAKWISECCNNLLFVNVAEQLERQRL